MPTELSTEQKLVNFVTNLLVVSAIALYLYAVVQIGLISLNHPNFIPQKDAAGQVVLEDGQPKMVANSQPTIPDTIAIIDTTIGAALALNFGAVIGISVTKAGTRTINLDPNALNGGPVAYANIPNLENLAKPAGAIANLLKGVIEGFVTAVVDIGKGLLSLHVRYWAVLVYLLALAIGVIFFIKDGGFSPEPGTIAVDLKNAFLTAVGIGGAVMSNLKKTS